MPELLADDPIFAATPSDAHWARVVAWTFGVLVDADDSGNVDNPQGALALPGVPPAVGTALGLRSTSVHDALAAEGSHADISARKFGAGSKLGHPCGGNALWKTAVWSLAFMSSKALAPSFRGSRKRGRAWYSRRTNAEDEYTEVEICSRAAIRA